MIIILGPDHSGKSTLTEKLKALGYNAYHFIRESNYEDYIKPLAKLNLLDAVLDRHAICEWPYARIMERKFKFSTKEWHNLLLLTLVQNPLIILCTHKPFPSQYDENQYLPYDKWDECLALYKEFLASNHIPFLSYDYTTNITPKALSILERSRRDSISWWTSMWLNGWGCVGSLEPKILLVAERIGPNNLNCIPFETGPTGYMLSTLLTQIGMPLGKFAVTNLVKSFRRDDRPPNQEDLDLLRVELEHLKPGKVVFMGAVAKQGAQVTQSLGIPHFEVTHLGYFHHRTRTLDVPEQYVNHWRNIVGITPHLQFKVQG